MLSQRVIVQLNICVLCFFRKLSFLVSLLPLQKMKEYLEGRNLITKLQAKHDLLQKTLGESECEHALRRLGRAKRPNSALVLSQLDPTGCLSVSFPSLFIGKVLR